MQLEKSVSALNLLCSPREIIPNLPHESKQTSILWTKKSQSWRFFLFQKPLLKHHYLVSGKHLCEREEDKEQSNAVRRRKAVNNRFHGRSGSVKLETTLSISSKVTLDFRLRKTACSNNVKRLLTFKYHRNMKECVWIAKTLPK